MPTFKELYEINQRNNKKQQQNNVQPKKTYQEFMGQIRESQMKQRLTALDRNIRLNEAPDELFSEDELAAIGANLFQKYRSDLDTLDYSNPFDLKRGFQILSNMAMVAGATGKSILKNQTLQK